MGFFTTGTAKESSGGALTGAKTKPVVKAGVKLPKMIPTKLFKVPVPRDCVAGDEFRAELDGVDTILKVPADFNHTRGTRITHTVRGDDDLVITSTLPYVPGYEIVVTKPVVYGVVMAPNLTVHDLIQQAQDQLTSQAILVNCNAVLGVSFSVTTDEKDKTPVVFAFGTPCVVMEGTKLPAVLPTRGGDTVTTTATSEDGSRKLPPKEESKEPEDESDVELPSDYDSDATSTADEVVM